MNKKFRSTFGSWKRLSAHGRRLTFTGSVLLPVMVLFVAIGMLAMRQAALNNARQDEANLGTAIAGQTSLSIQAIDLVLKDLQQQAAAQKITTPQEFAAAYSSEAANKALRQAGSGLPQLRSFDVVGADGKLLNFSPEWPTPPENLTDRAYFQYLKTHDDQSLYLSKPLQSRIDGTWTLFAVRRVDSPSGQFLGLVMGTVKLEYFTGFYHSLVSRNGLTVTLLNRNGDIIASYPPLPHTGHTLMPPRAPYNQWTRIVASGHPGNYEAPGVLSGGVHLNEVVPLQNYPLVVSLGVTKSDVLTNWRRESWIAAGGTVVAIICIALVLRALVLQLRRVEKSEANLALQNTALKQAEAAITYRANHDDLTGLANRSAFRQRLGEAIGQAVHNGQIMAVLYLDLDRFKIANDTRGHDFGDKLLVQLAARLRNLVAASDIVARTGGDEFAILRPVISSHGEMILLARILLESIKQPFAIEGTQCRIGSSIGIACYPAHGANEGELLRNADMALYQAKGRGGDAWCMFDDSMHARQREIFALEQGLRQALELRQFELNYQPIVDTGSGRILACEALLRWRHPERGLIPPMDFIALAESLGLITAIGYWVLETACAEAASWPVPLTVSVNLSPIQFRDDGLYGKIGDILRRTGLPPEHLALEITEGLLLEDSVYVCGIMERLQKLGVRITLDDFGTGHSGLGYLRRFPLHGIKIDKLFVHGVDHQPQARAIISGLMMIASALKLYVVAEGIENEVQLAALRQLGCTLAQGYFTGPPQTPDEFRALIQQNRQKRPGATMSGHITAT